MLVIWTVSEHWICVCQLCVDEYKQDIKSQHNLVEEEESDTWYM